MRLSLALIWLGGCAGPTGPTKVLPHEDDPVTDPTPSDPTPPVTDTTTPTTPPASSSTTTTSTTTSTPKCTAIESDDDGDDGVVDTKLYFDLDPTDYRVLFRELDTDLDGAADYWLRYTYDADGNLIRVVDSDGATEDRVYGPDGIESDVHDYDGDGITDQTDTWTYDAGLPIEQDEDYDGDGAADVVWSWQYDAGGRLIYDEIDEGNDGIADVTDTYAYDDQGRLSTQDQLLYGAHALQTWSYTDPVSPDEGTIDVDEGIDGTVDHVVTFRNDAQGYPLYLSYDWDLDGVLDYEDTQTWDADHHELSNDETSSYPYRYEDHQSWTYDPLGRPIEVYESYDQGPGSAFASRSTTVYGGSCP